MQVKSIAECSHWSILQYLRPSLSYHLPLRPLFLSIFEWPLKTGFTVFISTEIAVNLLPLLHIWASRQENLSWGICQQQRCRPARASAQTDQRLCYTLTGKYHI